MISQKAAADGPASRFKIIALRLRGNSIDLDFDNAVNGTASGGSGSASTWHTNGGTDFIIDGGPNSIQIVLPFEEFVSVANSTPINLVFNVTGNATLEDTFSLPAIWGRVLQSRSRQMFGLRLGAGALQHCLLPISS